MLKVGIDKFDIKGAGVSNFRGRKLYIWGALPQEEVEVKIIKRKRRYYEAIVENVLKPSPFRIESREEHFLSCSPFQILQEDKEAEFKKDLAVKFFQEETGVDISDAGLVDAPEYWGYRRKVEYSTVDQNGKISLAYHLRGRKEKQAIDACLLVDPRLNEKINLLLQKLQEKGFSADMIKTIMGRSNEEGEILIGVFTYLNKQNFEKKFADFELDLDVKGLQIFYSTPLSPASIPTDLIYSQGKFFLEEEFEGLKFSYGFFSFFQNNWQVFKKILADIEKFVDEDSEIVDFYAGVGVIGISLSKKAGKVELVEINKEAVEYAKKNICKNQIGNVAVFNSPAEAALEFIKRGKVVILDPARSGLHKRILKRLNQEKPRKIIYLSCNLKTQAEDILFLLQNYRVSFVKFYNMFARTPHLESLVILELRHGR